MVPVVSSQRFPSVDKWLGPDLCVHLNDAVVGEETLSMTFVKVTDT